VTFVNLRFDGDRGRGRQGDAASLARLRNPTADGKKKGFIRKCARNSTQRKFRGGGTECRCKKTMPLKNECISQRLVSRDPLRMGREKNASVGTSSLVRRGRRKKAQQEAFHEDDYFWGVEECMRWGTNAETTKRVVSCQKKESGRESPLITIKGVKEWPN